MERKIILIITLLLICISKLYGTEAVMHFESYNCSDHHGNYTEGSVYQHNMNTLFNNFSSQTPSRRFYNSTFGDFPNKVYGLYQCREGMVLEICSQCIKEATQKITEGCRLFSEGIVWFDECVLRYANRSIFSLSEVNPSTAGYYEETVSNYDKLRPVIEDKFSSVIDQAVRMTGQVHFGSTYANYTPTDKVYFFAQCTPDIDSVSCKKCLKTGLADIYAYYNMSKGVTTFYPSCQLGYDTVFSLLLYLLPPPTSSSPKSTPSVPAKVKSNYDGSKRKVSTKLIMAITIPVVIMSICAIIILAFLICTNKTKIFKNYKDVPVPSGSDIILLESLHYDIATLQSATDNFSKEKKLGEGGFGSVYKGTLPNGQEIAVKRLSKGSYQGVQEFSNEVLLVTKLEHRNLVRILGFCLADEEKLLVYEYVANKSLDYHLFDIEKHRILNWETRYQIIAGIARGMLYLHKDSRLKIIHRDLKPSNVLLDEKMNPKISDFGMARIFCMDQTGANTSRVVGTYGYMAPEYALRGQFSDKSDVYSFGVLVLEIISGQRNSSFNQSEAVELLSYAWKKWRDGKPLEFVDSRIKESCSSNEVLRCMQLGLLCVQEIMNDRPTMETAVLVLHSNSYTLPMPQEPIFYNWGTRKYNSLGTISPYNPYTKNSMPLLSTNDLSVSEIYPR